MIQAPAEPEELVSEVKVQIGRDWTHHRFGKPVPRTVAWVRAVAMLEALK